MKKNKMLIVYNTCGVIKDKTRGPVDTTYRRYMKFYINTIQALTQQDFDNYKIVVSMYKNSVDCKKGLAKEFGDKISYVYYDKDTLTVSQTFNRTVQLAIAEFGDFDSYLYLDSGVNFGPVVTENHPVHGKHEYKEQNRGIARKMYKLLQSGPYAIVEGQVDWDAGFEQIGFKYDSNPPAQIQGENFIVPLGKAVNTHIRLWSHEFYEEYNKILWPDVFAAYCSESIFSFLAAAMHKKWVILKDEILHHSGIVENKKGSNSADFYKYSPVYHNSWNNLLFDRNALDFINDTEAIEAGLGYEEGANIMMHKKDAFDENGNAKYPEKLKKVLFKYFFATKEELDYEAIPHKAIWSNK